MKKEEEGEKSTAVYECMNDHLSVSFFSLLAFANFFLAVEIEPDLALFVTGLRAEN